jgi:hypothetical protein
MEDIIPKKLDDVAIPGFRPSRLPSKSSTHLAMRQSIDVTMNLLRSLIDKPKLTQQANQAAVLKLAHEFAFQSIDRTREDELADDTRRWCSLEEFVNLSRKLAIDHTKNVSDVLVT